MPLKCTVWSFAVIDGRFLEQLRQIWDRKLFKRLIKNSPFGNHVRIIGSDSKRLIQISIFLSEDVSALFTLDAHVNGDPLERTTFVNFAEKRIYVLG